MMQVSHWVFQTSFGGKQKRTEQDSELLNHKSKYDTGLGNTFSFVLSTPVLLFIRKYEKILPMLKCPELNCRKEE